MKILKNGFRAFGSHRITEIMMKLVLLNDYFRAQIIYTCFWRRLAKKELYHLFSLQTGHKKKGN